MDRESISLVTGIPPDEISDELISRITMHEENEVRLRQLVGPEHCRMLGIDRQENQRSN